MRVEERLLQSDSRVSVNFQVPGLYLWQCRGVSGVLSVRLPIDGPSGRDGGSAGNAGPGTGPVVPSFAVWVSRAFSFLVYRCREIGKKKRSRHPTARDPPQRTKIRGNKI